jgi:tetratricopeptide (TPR) repeat protein
VNALNDVNTRWASTAQLPETAPMAATSDADFADRAQSTHEARAAELFRSADELMAAGRYAEALDSLHRAMELAPCDAGFLKQAECLEKLGRPYAAAGQYEAYLSANPNAADAGEVRARMDALLKRADAEPISATGAAGADEWLARGNKAMREQRYYDAVSAFQDGFMEYPDDRFILGQGDAFLKAGRFTEADLAYQRYLVDPNAPRAAEARESQRRARDAVGGHEANVTDIPVARQAFERASELQKQGRYVEAATQYAASYSHATAPETLWNQAHCLERAGRREEAAALYARFAGQLPTSPDAATGLARAQRLHNEATQLAAAAAARGEAAFADGRYGDAALAFQEALAHSPSPSLRRDFAVALDHAGDTAAALREYRHYLAEAPDAEGAVKVRERIEDLRSDEAIPQR